MTALLWLLVGVAAWFLLLVVMLRVLGATRRIERRHEELRREQAAGFRRGLLADVVMLDQVRAARRG